MRKYRSYLVLAIKRCFLLVLLTVFNLTSVAISQASDTTVLTVTTMDGVKYRLKLGSSELSRAVIKTNTPWTKGVQEFSGVPLKDLLHAAGIDEIAAEKLTLKARALNDYEVEIPAQDAYDFDVLVADTMNGEAMPVNRFGPFWIVYPRDAMPELQDSRFDHRWVWQLSDLRVE